MRSRLICAVAAMVTATVLPAVSLSNCGDGITPPPPPPTEVITFNSIAPSNGEVLVQRNCVSVSDCDRTLIQVSANAVSNVTGAVSLSFWLNGNSVGSVSPSSVTVGFGSHSLRILATGKSSSRDTTVAFSVRAAPPIVVECISHSIGGTPLDCSLLRAWAIKGNVRDSADAVNNRMEIHPRLRLLPDTGHVQIVVDFRDTTSRTHYGRDPFVSKDSLSLVQKVILVPMNYTIPGGRWALQIQQIDLIKAFLRPVNLDGTLGLPYLLADGADGFSRINIYNLQTTPLLDMPFPFAFDWQNSNIPLDSVSIHNYASELGSNIGWNITIPANLNQAKMSGKFYVRIVGDSTKPTDYVDNSPAFCTIWIRKWNGENGEILNRFDLKHELTHCLGVGHTPWPPYGPESWWPSLMGVVGVSPSDPRFAVAMPQDVANLRHWYEVDALEKQVSGKKWPTGLCSLAHAHQWQRVRAGLPREFPGSC